MCPIITLLDTMTRLATLAALIFITQSTCYGRFNRFGGALINLFPESSYSIQ